MEATVSKDVWKCATTILGALSAMTFGRLKMPMWLVNNLDLIQLVS